LITDHIDALFEDANIAEVSQKIKERGMYKMLFVERHELLRRFTETVEEDVNWTGMDEAEMGKFGIAHPKEDAKGKLNYVAYVQKVMLFAMRSRHRLGMCSCSVC
jgi:hypothetical protein